jgi:serine/threonine protein kinase
VTAACARSAERDGGTKDALVFAVATDLEDGRHYMLALRPGTLLDGIYRITRVLGHSSAFAVTYLAHDEWAPEQVVVKEFLPRTLAGRAPDEVTVRPHSPDDAVTLGRTLRRFVREAELLADIAHPNIPRVRRHFEANGTAYLVMQHYEGKSLTEYVAAAAGRLAVDRALGLVLQVLQGLEALHSEGIVHGYITPDNVLVDDNSRALVLGLGTTRHVVGHAREPATGFAPIEQYASREVGPWTDVYACAALLYRLMTGLTPPSAVERSAGQSIPPSWAAGANVPSSLARTVMGALAQLPDARPHSAEEFRRRLDASLAIGTQATASRVDPWGRNARWPATDATELPAAASAALGNTPESPATVVLELEPEPAQLEEPYFSTTTPPGDRVRRLLRLVLGSGGAAAAILLAVSVLRGGSDNDPAGGGGASAPPAASANAQQRPASAPVTRRAKPTDRRPAPDAATRPAPAGPVLQQAIAGAPRAAPTRAAAPGPSSGQQAPAKMPTQGGSADGAVDRAVFRSIPMPGSMSVSLPASVTQIEFLPVEVAAGLRERLEHGKEKAALGEYASARQIFGAGLTYIADLSDRYADAQTLVLVRQQFEQAAERAAASCRAENAIARRRNGKTVQCE